MYFHFKFTTHLPDINADVLYISVELFHLFHLFTFNRNNYPCHEEEFSFNGDPRLLPEAIR